MCRIILLFFALVTSATTFAQTTEDQINVYLDCPGCDLNYVKNEIKFVNYANDPLRAQVHILVSSQTTGSSGAIHQL